MGQPKRQHFLPQFYLENFCREGVLWIRDCDRKEQRKQTPKNTAVIGYYYSIEGDGQRDHAVETMLSQVEGHAKPVIEALIQGQAITQAQKQDLALFLALLWDRVPDFQRSIEKIEGFLIKLQMMNMFRSAAHAENVLKRYEKEKGCALPSSGKEVFEFASKGEFDVKVHRNESIRMMLELSPEFGIIFSRLDWVVAHCPDTDSFVTSDNPLILTQPPSRWTGPFQSVHGILTPGCDEIVPLGRSCCLIMQDSGEETLHVETDSEMTKALNRLIASYVQRYLIAPDEDLLSDLSAIADASYRTRDGRFQIG